MDKTTLTINRAVFSGLCIFCLDVSLCRHRDTNVENKCIETKAGK